IWRGDTAARRAVPDLYRAVIAGRGDEVSIGTEGHRIDVAGVPPEGEQFLSRRHVPNAQGVVYTGGDPAPTVWTNRQALDVIDVARHGRQEVSVGRVPDLYGLGRAPREQLPAVGTEREAPGQVQVGTLLQFVRQLYLYLSCLGVPDLDNTRSNDRAGHARAVR